MSLPLAPALRAVAGFAVAIGALSVHAQSPASAPAPPPNATVQQPRSFGYVLGDVLTQRVLLQIDARPFEPAGLPDAARLGAWLERRTPRIETGLDGRRWLAVDYQLINAPQTLASVSVPAWELKPKSGATPLRIAAWPISVSPLTPPVLLAQSGLEELRPDRPAPTIPTEPIRRRTAIWCSALSVTLAAWLGWLLWRNWRARSTQPFARALRELRRAENSAPDAWLTLHRAFDRTAGNVVQMANLATLFQRAPYLSPLRSRIEQFFAQSAALFFGAGLPASPLSLRQLCSDLRQIEKRQER